MLQYLQPRKERKNPPNARRLYSEADKKRSSGDPKNSCSHLRAVQVGGVAVEPALAVVVVDGEVDVATIAVAPEVVVCRN